VPKFGNLTPPKFLAGGGGKKGGKKEPKGPADTSLRDAHQFDQELRRAQMDILRAQQDLSTSYIERNTIAVQILDAERAAFKATLDYEVAAKEKTSAQAGQLLALYDTKDSLERQRIIAEEQAQAAEDSARLNDLTFELDRDVLQSQQVLAETSKEQREVQLRLLDLFYRQETARLEAVLADERSSDLAKEEARRRLVGLGETRAAATEEVMRGTRSPWEEYAAGIPDTADKMQEALERVRVDGVEALSDSLVGVITGVKSVGDAFKEVANQIIADLLRIYIRKMLVGALGNALGGMGGIFGSSSTSVGHVSGGGTLPPLPGIPGYASGGSFSVLGRGGTDRNVLSLNGLPIAKVSHGERVNVSNDNIGGGGAARVTIVPTPYFDAVVDGRAAKVAAPMAGQAAMVGAAGGSASVMRRQSRMLP
jgi:lambda family phage tail tape measure protein